MSDTDLFSPLQLGPTALKNRMVMAPLTRNRSTPEGVPHAQNVEYYRQRASAGLILSEATCIMPEGVGYPLTPGIWNAAQVFGWKPVTEAVHAAGGTIYCQLWHVGRISHPDLQPNGQLPVAPSAVQPAGDAFTLQGLRSCS
jgi:N-ethylmaleimide reductase